MRCERAWVVAVVAAGDDAGGAAGDDAAAEGEQERLPGGQIGGQRRTQTWMSVGGQTAIGERSDLVISEQDWSNLVISDLHDFLDDVDAGVVLVACPRRLV